MKSHVIVSFNILFFIRVISRLWRREGRRSVVRKDSEEMILLSMIL